MCVVCDVKRNVKSWMKIQIQKWYMDRQLRAAVNRKNKIEILDLWMNSNGVLFFSLCFRLNISVDCMTKWSTDMNSFQQMYQSQIKVSFIHIFRHDTINMKTTFSGHILVRLFFLYHFEHLCGFSILKSKKFSLKG